MSGGVAMQTDGWHMFSFSHGMLFWEYVAGQQWMRLLIALSWLLLSQGGGTF